MSISGINGIPYNQSLRLQFPTAKERDEANVEIFNYLNDAHLIGETTRHVGNRLIVLGKDIPKIHEAKIVEIYQSHNGQKY